MNPAAEWLEADGLGGFAMGRADGVRTRRYHGLLTVATTPPTGRVVLVNGFDAWIERDGERYALSSQRYAPDVTHPDGASCLTSFTRDPWPTWTYRLPSDIEVVQELVASHGEPVVALSWRVREASGARLAVRPFLSGRDAHGTHHENASFDFTATVDGPRVTWRPYPHLPAVTALANGEYTADAAWYRNFQYDEERARGLDFLEDLASPGVFTFTLDGERAVLVLGATDLTASPDRRPPTADGTTSRSWTADRRPEAPSAIWDRISAAERRRRAEFSTLHRAADDFLVRRGSGKTIVAGYPWFSDWGRDTFIALRGLCLAGDRLDDARDILLEWSRHVSEGMLPNFFPEGGRPAEYNSVDASLWFVVAVHDFLQAAEARGAVDPEQTDALFSAVEAIVAGYARGTRFGIRADGTGLLAAGEPGVQLTWMDARIGDWVVTPRIGKPVEVQALWINALRVAALRSPRWGQLADFAESSFAQLFWYDKGGYLYDVVDVDHRGGAVDNALRPNQIFAVGGLPFPLLSGDRARRVVEAVETHLWTPAGLRTLAPGAPAYVPRYAGDMRSRDSAYHQGTVWPWLMGAFVDAWVRVRGGSDAARREARRRFLEPLLAHYDAPSPGHLGEVADAEPPYTPGGCPMQAWSVGEALRMSEEILQSREAPARRRGQEVGAGA